MFVVLAAIGYAAVLAGSLVVTVYAMNVFQTELPSQIQNAPYPYPSQNPSLSYQTRQVPLIHQDGEIRDSSEPHIVTLGLEATDLRSNLSKLLRVDGYMNNTGAGTAYNAVLHVVAMNSSGVAIDTDYGFGGMTGHVSLGLHFSLPYSGSEIANCTITPIYTATPQLQNLTLFAP